MSRADARLERLLAAGLRAAAVRGVTRRAPVGRGRRGRAPEAAWPRAEDFARALGLDGAEVRDLIRFDRALAALPRVAAAYDAGDLPRAKLAALLPAVTPDTEDLWLTRAARHDAAALGAIGAGVPGGPPACSAPAAGSTRASGPATDPGAAPARAAGRPATPSAGDEFPVWMSVTATVREALRPLGPGTDPAALIAGRIEEPVEGPKPSATLFDTCGEPDHARDEARLRGLVAVRQSVEWRLGRLLAAMARHGLHRDIGFPSLEAWAAVVPGLPPARVAELLNVDRLLEGLPATTDAWRRGRITRRQARLVARVAAGGHEREWLRLAVQSGPQRFEALAQAAATTAAGALPACGPGGGAAIRQAFAPGARGMTIGAPLTGSRNTSTSTS